MTRRISITERTARWLLDNYRLMPASNNRVSQELERALARQKSPKKVQARRATRARKTEKAKTKREETAEVHKAVFARASRKFGYPTCEACSLRTASEMHHVFGRVRVKQSERNCVALCRWCHAQFTEPDSAIDVWRTAENILRGIGSEAEADEARALRQKHGTKAAFAEARKGASHA